MSSNKPASKRRDKDDTNNPDVNLPGIGNYLFQKTVGEGNFAKVKLASHKLTGAEVAVKIIDKTQLDEKKISKLYREVRIMKMLHHPNIVKLFEVIETKSTIFLVMEYASGGELYDYLVVHGKMKEKEARSKFRQILSAVSYCHKQRVIHRDLKAENLLLDHNFDIKIADFGFSNYYDPDTKLDTFCGSPPYLSLTRYAAPELFQGRRYTGPEVDIWSLGVILYVLTTGCLPFDGKNLQEMRESVCRGKYRIPFFLSDGCEKLLKKLLVRDPAKRNKLEILTDDQWINETYGDSPISTDLSEVVVEDENVIKLMESKFKLDRDSVLSALRENVYNDTSAIYFLLYYQSMSGTRAENDLLDRAKGVSIKKDVNSPNQPVSLMPIIDEDGEMPVMIFANQKKGSVSSATSAKPSIVATTGRRRRATTTNEGDGSEIANVAIITKGKAPRSSTTSPADIPEEVDKVEESIVEPVEPRKRHNTIVGIFMSQMRKGPEVEEAGRSLGPGKSAEKNSSGETNKPRSLRFTFNSNTTSIKPPDEIIAEVVRCCHSLGFSHHTNSRYLIECSHIHDKEELKFEIEVCKLPRLNNLHGLRFKRLVGSTSEYKNVCEQILSAIQL